MRVQLHNISKEFGTLKALDRVDLVAESGTIHGVIGENGAGKTTLMKILAGFLEKSHGRVLLDNRAVELHTPKEAAALGIGMLYQEPLDFHGLTVLENFMVGRLAGPGSKHGEAMRRFSELAREFGFSLDPKKPMGGISLGERQQVEFLRLMDRRIRVLILDEPFTGIAVQQQELLFAALETFARQGNTVLLVSHKLPDVMSLCQQVTVLRHGRAVGRVQAPLEAEELLFLMFGSLPARQKQSSYTPGSSLLSINNLSGRGERNGCQQCSLSICQGEVVGVAGLAGSGQGVFLRLAAGLGKPLSGQVLFQGKNVNNRPARFRKLGGAFLPSHRLEEGLFTDLTMAEHWALARQEDKRILDWPAAAAGAAKAIKRFQVKAEPHSRANSLSGGNQQRFMLSLVPKSPALLILEDPSRGLDHDSSHWVWQHLLTYARQRCAILFWSPDLDEIMSHSSRVLVFYEGRLVLDHPRQGLDREKVARAMTGESVGEAA